MKNDLKQDKTDALLRLALEEQMEQGRVSQSV